MASIYTWTAVGCLRSPIMLLFNVMRPVVSVQAGLTLFFLGADAMGQEAIPLTAVCGYPPAALWVESFLTSFILKADRRLAATGNYELDWNTPFGSVAKPGSALETVQYGLADIGIITTSFHSDKVPFYIAEGRFESASEAVRAGLRMLEAEEARLEMLKTAIREGVESGISDRTPEDVRSDVRARLADSGRLSAK